MKLSNHTIMIFNVKWLGTTEILSSNTNYVKAWHKFNLFIPLHAPGILYDFLKKECIYALKFVNKKINQEQI